MTNDYEIKWYKYDMLNYQSFFKSNIVIKDKPKIIFHIEYHKSLEYLKNIYKFVSEFKNSDNFMYENAFKILNDKDYPSKTVEFLGNDNFVESFYIKDNMIDSNLYKINNERKIKC